MIVLDASAALEILLETPLGLRHASKVFGQVRHAPHLIDIEFTQALRRLVLVGELSSERAHQTLGIFDDIALVRHAHAPLLPRIWELRSSHSAYDATYVALAESLGMPLITCDSRLSRSYGHHAKILLLA